MLPRIFPLLTLAATAAAIMPRQTDSDSPSPPPAPTGSLPVPPGMPALPKCAKDLMDLMHDAPLPPPSVMRWMMDYGMTASRSGPPSMPTDGCPPFVKDMPASLAPSWTSYQSSASSWSSEHSAELSSVMSACPAPSGGMGMPMPTIGACTVVPTAIGSGSASDDDDSDSSSAGSRTASRSGSVPATGSGAGASRSGSAGDGSGAIGLNAQEGALAALAAGIVAMVALL